MDDKHAAEQISVQPCDAPNAVPNTTDGCAQAAVGPAAVGNNVFKQLIGLAVAAVFLYFAFKGIDFQSVFAAMQSVDKTAIAVLVVSGVVSHWLRAVRWVIMLKPLSEKKSVSVWNSFCAVMFGYAVNIPIPRGGEVVRVVSISKSEQLPWMGVVPTLLIDRLLDFALLVIFIGLTLAVLPADMKSNAQFLMPAGVVMCMAVVVGLALLPKAAAIIRAILAIAWVQAKLPGQIKEKLTALADQFEQGTRSLNNPLALLAIAVLSFAIWGFYFLNMLITLYAFGLWPHGVELSRAFIAWTISSVSVIAPTPGCVGTYHIATSKALSMVAGVDPVKALALATLAHAVNFVLLPVVVAAVCFVIQNRSSRRQKAA